MRQFMWVAVLLLGGCSPNSSVGVLPSGPEESVVAKHILETTVNPQSVRFLKWGPHDLEGTVAPPFQIVRVRCQVEISGNIHPQDVLFHLKDGKVGFFFPTVGGDDWLTTRQTLGGFRDIFKQSLEKAAKGPYPVVNQ